MWWWIGSCWARRVEVCVGGAVCFVVFFSTTQRERADKEDVSATQGAGMIAMRSFDTQSHLNAPHDRSL